MLPVVMGPLAFGAFALGFQIGEHRMREEVWRVSDRCRELLRSRVPKTGEDVHPPTRLKGDAASGDSTP